MLPEQLAELGVFEFDQHALWRDPRGRISAYLTAEERYKRGQNERD